MRAIALCSLLLLAACGDGLYDAAGLPAVKPVEATCVENQAVCRDNLGALTCPGESPTQCGGSCEDCTKTVIDPPAGAQVECLSKRAPDGRGLCGFVCADGFLACTVGGSPSCCGATAVAAGDSSSYALLTNGTVRAWGANGAGQIGDGTTTDRLSPAPVLLPQSPTAIAIGAGSDHACAVLAGGAVRCWGNNTNGQVTGTSTSASVSTPAASPVTAGAIAVAVGASHTCALLGTGSVTCWGSNLLGQTSGAAGITGATAIAAGTRHTCVVAGSAVKCWGGNGLGQLGGTPVAGVATPIASGIQHLAAYADHTCAATGSSTGVNIDDSVRCWGDVLGANFAFASPQPVPKIPEKDSTHSTIRFAVDRITSGTGHVCVRGDLKINCFGGDNAKGQLGGPAAAGEPTTVNLPDNPPLASEVAAGADHTCAVLPSTALRTTPGALRCWGKNDNGQLGDGTLATPPVGQIVTPKGT